MDMMNMNILYLSASEWLELATFYKRKAVMDKVMEKDFGLVPDWNSVTSEFSYVITDPKKYMFFKLRWGFGLDNLGDNKLDFS
jgi:hypothetical protein